MNFITVARAYLVGVVESIIVKIAYFSASDIDQGKMEQAGMAEPTGRTFNEPRRTLEGDKYTYEKPETANA